MAGLMNKRQIARNERTLQDLLKQPGNDQCADCFTRNPGWASWSLGIFLCVRCASLHRKLGTHISKVKSLSMDAWTQEQVESMKKVGNVTSNRKFNPKQQNPNIPIDADEIDSAMERFVREKYQHKTLSGENRPLPSIRHHTGSSDSSNDVPPPPPPKNGPRMAPVLRSQSSTYPSQAPLPSPPASDWGSSGSRSGDVRRMGGIPEGSAVNGAQNSFDLKLEQLKDMGFANQTRNATILKGCGGDVMKAVDTLTRLGEGYGNVLPKTRPAQQQANGISFEQKPAVVASPQHTSMSAGQQPSRPPSSASNPFARQQTTQMSLPQQQAEPQPHPGALPLNQSFQNMQISQHPDAESAQLFPHKTGTWPAQQTHAQNNPFLQNYTPPITPAPQQQFNASQMQADAGNPFLRSVRSQTLPQSNPFIKSQPTGAVNSQQNMYMVQQQQQVSPQDFFMQQPQESQHLQGQYAHFQAQPVQSPGPMDNFGLVNNMQQPHPQNHFTSNMQFQSYPLPQQAQGMYAAQSTTPQPQQLSLPQNLTSAQMQPFGFRDKNSIMALYGSGNPYQTQLQGSAQPQAPVQNAGASSQHLSPQPQRSVTMPVAGTSTNPFAMSGPAAGPGHVSRDSMMFTSNAYPGRSASPDAFSGLSARLG